MDNVFPTHSHVCSCQEGLDLFFLHIQHHSFFASHSTADTYPFTLSLLNTEAWRYERIQLYFLWLFICFLFICAIKLTLLCILLHHQYWIDSQHQLTSNTKQASGSPVLDFPFPYNLLLEHIFQCFFSQVPPDNQFFRIIVFVSIIPSSGIPENITTAKEEAQSAPSSSQDTYNRHLKEMLMKMDNNNIYYLWTHKCV